MDAQRATHLAMTFGCNIGSMPFTYLGLPLGTHRPAFQDFMPLMNKIEKKVEWNQQDVKLPRETHSCELSFSAMPTFYMCSLTLPPQVVKQIDRYRKRCLWSDGDIHRKGSCLAA
jgi:hypothetical protein